MEDDRIEKDSWIVELTEQVREAIARVEADQRKDRPALEGEYKLLQGKCRGWSESLANPILPPAIWQALVGEWTAALNRMTEIESTLTEDTSRQQLTDQIVDPSEVERRLDRLADVLANYSPTVGNLELSMHIDRIVCWPDRTVTMRTCKLGSLAGAVELLSENGPDPQSGGDDDDATRPTRRRPAGPRRRGRLRVPDLDEDRDTDSRAMTEFAADPNRFANLGDEWFWTDTFEIPERISWAREHAEEVFRRRQEAKLSYAKLAAEFGVTAPTARAAVKCYLEANPEVQDEVNLPRGGKRPPKFDLAVFGHEARALWEAGWSKLKLAARFGCSSPTIDKALNRAYEQDGLTMPSRHDRLEATASQSRRLLDDGASLDNIARELGVSDVTARSYLCKSFANEGKPMPDLRSGRSVE